jgi:succinate-semialdehyde dehydrogenase / glutarate-semialdehyde dehydrogenase
LRIAEQIDAGSISVQDTFLTFAKLRKIGTHSFKLSGLGGSRTGPDSIMRFLRKKAIMVNTAQPEDILVPAAAAAPAGARAMRHEGTSP